MSDEEKNWLGCSLEEIYGKHGPWNYNVDPIRPSRYHCVLYDLETLNLLRPPKPHRDSGPIQWNNDYVRMPFSEKNLFPVNEGENKVLQPRWTIIQTSLLQPIKNSTKLESIIGSYNTKLPKLTMLHYFFEKEMGEDSKYFFDKLLPGIINLALQLPDLIQKNLPLLKQNMQRSISITQQQIASLLANAFLCTFPWRRDMATSYPDLNFIRLFTLPVETDRVDAIMNKLKSICHYFRRVLDRCPVGVVTFERKSLTRNQFPRWDKEDKNLGNTRVHISNEGKIEDAEGLLQVDFANKFVGGGVLGYGCVQEEIRYIISPELIVSRLFTERLNSTEALLITGAERYSNYKGYSDSFEWIGNYNDFTPYDDFGRRKINVVAIDATPFNNSSNQYSSSMILRELNKAYVGFYSRYDKALPGVATGNWGCGAFGGDPYLKSLIQLIACSAAKRDLVYFTLGDTDLRDNFYNMYTMIAANQITIAKLWKYLCAFPSGKLSGDDLFAFIQQAHFDVKKQTSITDFIYKDTPSTSQIIKKKLDVTCNLSHSQKNQSTSQNCTDSVYKEKVVTIPSDDFMIDSDDNVIESSQPEIPLKKKVSNSDISNPNVKKITSEKILSIFENIDGKIEVKEINNKDSMQVDEVNNDDDQCFIDKSMELDEVIVETNESLGNICKSLNNEKPQKKITDYFKNKNT